MYQWIIFFTFASLIDECERAKVRPDSIKRRERQKRIQLGVKTA
jgi:hypothetical protein